MNSQEAAQVDGQSASTTAGFCSVIANAVRDGRNSLMTEREKMQGKA